jgi:UDP-N-acetylmuramyl pentapeptide phosphotransferase/UDP-N-acetylglucosamine-1-phosphate transferase
MNHHSEAFSVIVGILTVVFAALMTMGLIVILLPLLQRYALSMPTARSSHSKPTPQGGGIAVLAATLGTVTVASKLSLFGASLDWEFTVVIVAAIVMACIGVTDDVRPLPVGPRLFLQTLVVGGVIYSLPNEITILGPVPFWIERGLFVLGGLWFVNLVNFMDGIDWMTVAEVLPLTATLVVLGLLGALPPAGIIVALGLGGGILGFAYFNRPVAKLFLGDVGSLPIGLILGWLLLLVASKGDLLAATLMPLYYLADATITLARRLIRGDQVWQAHRTHFYQLATERGFTVIEVVRRVFFANLGLCALATIVVIVPAKPAHVAASFAGATLVARLLFTFQRGKQDANRY